MSALFKRREPLDGKDSLTREVRLLFSSQTLPGLITSGSRTAWTSGVVVQGGPPIMARYWYNSESITNADEDAAEKALESMGVTLRPPPTILWYDPQWWCIIYFLFDTTVTQRQVRYPLWFVRLGEATWTKVIDIGTSNDMVDNPIVHTFISDGDLKFSHQSLVRYQESRNIGAKFRASFLVLMNQRDSEILSVEQIARAVACVISSPFSVNHWYCGFTSRRTRPLGQPARRVY
ncbi:hypothetical protein GP486_002124 [Trichoglossum hirsutum]|uniref:Uncharacterized protein n=1 Tax=Trichoglossum hirsutum TaxID=265104 RepID=A0A9P8LFT8_9PEZI|nr:hypothetical protein GP486_002124 [Trichoglossum hirsutum]